MSILFISFVVVGLLGVLTIGCLTWARAKRIDYRLFLTYARVKYIEGRELTCLDLSEELWREVPACGGGSVNNWGAREAHDRR